MTPKIVKLPPDIHRTLAIQAATDGVSMTSIAERAIRRELDRMRKRAEAKKAATVTSDGTPTGA
jgi:hypothetical protein